MRPNILGIVCFAVLCITLTLGLWPFRTPLNQVAWLPNGNGLLLGKYGTLSTAASAGRLNTFADGSAAIEIWLQPRRIWDSGTFLALYDPKMPLILSLRQSQLDFLVKVRANRRTTTLYAKDVFRTARNRPVFLTITSDAHSTTVYVNGNAVITEPGFPFSIQTLTGRLILGTSPLQNDEWVGQLFGLALYGRGLTPPEVLRHYQFWTLQGKPPSVEDECVSALYLFDERIGNVVHNRMGPDPDLNIPAHYEVVDQLLLEPVWDEFEISRSYGEAALKNIVGFVPFGFCFYAWFVALRVRRATLLVLLSGVLTSLTIEVLQTFLPTRDSGTTDLITNTLGTWLGVVLCRSSGSLLDRLPPRYRSAAAAFIPAMPVRLH